MNVNEKMTAIADAIRDRTNGTKKLGLDDIPGEVETVYINGVDAGWEHGRMEGYNVGMEDGKQAEYDRFWDILQDNGDRRNYWGAFCGWSDEIFKPKHDIVADTANSMFYMSTITNVPEIDFRGTTGLASTFAYAQSLEKIDNIKLNEYGTQTFNAAFNGCKALREVRFEGVIGNDINFQACVALSKDSIENIFSVLSKSASGKTLTFAKAACLAAFGNSTSEEWQALIKPYDKWTITYV